MDEIGNILPESKDILPEYDFSQATVIGKYADKMKQRGMIILLHLNAANRVLQYFAPETTIQHKKHGLYINWNSSYLGKVSKKWMTKGQDFYPPWNNIWPHGGTACIALSQLIRWIQNKPVFPLSTWHYWTTDTIALLSVDAVKVLQDAKYPEKIDCVLCHTPIESAMDWYSCNGITGPMHAGKKKCIKAENDEKQPQTS